MSFFKKLKTKLFKSSSKIDEGLEAIVDEGASAADDAAEIARQQAEAQAALDQAERDRATEVARLRREADERAEAAAHEAHAAAERARAEAAAQAAAAEQVRVEEQKRLDQAAVAGAERARQLADQQAATEAARVAAEAKAAQAEQERLDAAQRAADAKAAQERAQIEARAAAEAEVDTPPEPARPAITTPITTLAPSALDQDETPAEPEKKGILGRLFKRDQPAVARRALDDDMLEQLEELLITADMGVDTALRVTANMAEGRLGKKLSVAEIKDLMASEVARIMEPVAQPMPLFPKKPQVVLVVGVNGSGKTTTIGKLALQFKAAGKSVVIAAGDTFRAAAVEQLQVWGERAGVPVLTAPEGSDPASLAFDAMTKAQEDGADLLMIDTAGRLQNRSDLMEELAKIVRVIRKKDRDAPHNTLLVLDATTGQNALTQVEIFQQVADVSGLVMTKLDGTAKGGVLVALADKFGLPIHAIGVGEQIDDLAPFDPREFADALVGVQ